ncbi:uncharacterized protein CEXT_408061 [Caerostris extrusa]|uniref:Uncharacterized protein n=1 Tax=Caerostris extrusa TaxID=172846 RepID=A0AAV4WD77_CAEEX|nr:uncharacterized protein CEXT_408061 [Caerostris extrusa]
MLTDFKADSLNCCTKELGYLLLKFFEKYDYSVQAIHFCSTKLFLSASNPHLYIFADLANMVFQRECYLLSIELYILGLTCDINVLLNAREQSLPKMYIDAVEGYLSIMYEKFTRFFKDISPEIIRECMFNSFLLLPSARKLNVIRELTYNVIDNNRRNLRSSRRVKIDHPLLDNRIIGIPNSFKKDLVIVFESIRPLDFRYACFNWRKDSMSKLENYLRSFNKKNGISHVEEKVLDTNTSTTLSEESVKRPMQSKTPKGIIPKKKLDTTHNVFKHQFTVDTVSEKPGNECQKANSLAKKRQIEEATDFSIAKKVVADNNIEYMHYANDSNNKLHMEQIQPLKFSELGKNDYILLERESGQSEIAKNVVEKMDFICTDESTFSSHSEKSLNQYEKMQVLPDDQHIAVLQKTWIL